MRDADDEDVDDDDDGDGRCKDEAGRRRWVVEDGLI